MKRIILIMVATLLTLTWTSSYGQSLHFICFADTDDVKIGKGVAKDVNLMLDFVMFLSNKIGMEDNLKPAIVMMGKDCNSKNLVSIINQFTCNPDDIVIFYYTGHGTRSFVDKSDFPQMCLTSTSQKDYIPLEYVKDAIEKKAPDSA